MCVAGLAARADIGERFATYDAVVKAVAKWMQEKEPSMSDSEASIIAACVCHGIDRDGDGELTYAEFGRFADETLAGEFSVAKLREFEVEREDEVGAMRMNNRCTMTCVSCRPDRVNCSLWMTPFVHGRAR